MFINQPFIKQRFIAMLILSYSSFTHFEEIQGLLVEQLVLINDDYSVHFKKGIKYFRVVMVSYLIYLIVISILRAFL